MADNSFTFWANMKETIDTYSNFPEFQLKMYDALTEYGLYGIWPEDDGSLESTNLISFVQSMVPSLDKSRNFDQKCEASGAAGGRTQKITDEQIEESVKYFVLKNRKIPSRKEVVEAIKEKYGIAVSEKTISRRFNDEKKKSFCEDILRQNRDINNVSGTLGQNEDKNETLGQNSFDPVGHDLLNMSLGIFKEDSAFWFENIVDGT